MRLRVENGPWREHSVCLVREEGVHPIKGGKPDVKVCILYIETVAMRLTVGRTVTRDF